MSCARPISVESFDISADAVHVVIRDGSQSVALDFPHTNQTRELIGVESAPPPRVRSTDSAWPFVVMVVFLFLLIAFLAWMSR